MIFLFIWCLKDCCITFSIKPLLLTLHLFFRATLQSFYDLSFGSTYLPGRWDNLPFPTKSSCPRTACLFIFGTQANIQELLPQLTTLGMFMKKEPICCVLFCSISFSPSICSFSPSSNEDFSPPQHMTVQSQSFKFKASCQHFQVCVCVCTNVANKFTERGHFLKASVPRKYWQSATLARRDAASSAKELSLSLCGALRCMLTQCQLLISQQTTTFSVYPHRNKAELRQSLHCVYTSRLKQSESQLNNSTEVQTRSEFPASLHLWVCLTHCWHVSG